MVLAAERVRFFSTAASHLKTPSPRQCRRPQVNRTTTAEDHCRGPLERLQSTRQEQQENVSLTTL